MCLHKHASVHMHSVALPVQCISKTHHLRSTMDNESKTTDKKCLSMGALLCDVFISIIVMQLNA